MPKARCFLGTGVLDWKSYAIGGATSGVTVSSVVEVYNPDTDLWSTESPMQTTRQTFFSGAVGDKIYAIGGSYPNPQNSASPVILSSVEEYSILTTGNKISFDIQHDPYQIKLGQNYPNPFNSVTSIPYELYSENYVRLLVYNLLGQEVETLVTQKQPTGKYQVVFSGEKLAKGIYYYQIQVKSENSYQFSDARKLTLIK